MTAHSKRDYSALNQTDNYFDQCFQIHVDTYNITTQRELDQLDDYLSLEWQKARSYGIPESDICKFIYIRKTNRSIQRSRMPTFTQR